MRITVGKIKLLDHCVKCVAVIVSVFPLFCILLHVMFNYVAFEDFNVVVFSRL